MPLPSLRVYIGFTSPSTTAVFTVGHPTLGQVGLVPIGADDTWVEVTQWVRSWQLRRGMSRGDDPTQRYDPGVCTVIFNDGDRRFDPENLAGPYVSAGRSQVEPMRRVRIVGAWDGIDYPLLTGLTDAFKPDYDGNSWTTTTMTATDAFKVFAGIGRDPVAPVGAGETSGARITRILDAGGWPATDRLISTGDTTLQATDLSGNMLAELQLVQDTEQGELYVDGQGRVVFRNRRAMLTDARSATSQVTFGDGGYAATGELPYADAAPTSGEDAVNTVAATRVGGTEQLAIDPVSISRYLRQDHTRSDLLMETDTEANNWAEWLLYQYGNPARRFQSVEFNRPRPDLEAAMWPQLLGREIGDRITVKRRPAGGGAPIVRDCIIRGISHESDGHTWKTVFTLQGADRYSFFTVGHPVLGRVGYNAVAW